MKKLRIITLCLILISLALYFLHKHHLFRNQELFVKEMNRIIKQPTVAGLFYPENKEELNKQIATFLSSQPQKGYNKVRAVLVPHAGYVYSGEVAAAAFREVGSSFKTVFVLAANHNGDISYSGVSLPHVTHYAIPGSLVAVSQVSEELKKNKLFTNKPKAHTMYMIENELPFLQYLKNKSSSSEFSIIPMILGDMTGDQIDELTQILNQYNQPDTLFVFSADLSHFFTYSQANVLDSFTVQALMSRDKKALDKAATDGVQVLKTMISLVEKNGWEPGLVEKRNSGDVTGDHDSVVGYAGMVFHKPFYLTEKEQKKVLHYAREVIKDRLRLDETREDPLKLLKKVPKLGIKRGVFVTLKKQGVLRGCMGTILPSKTLVQAISENAINAAFYDPRFDPITLVKELDDMSFSITVLDYPQKISVQDPKEYADALTPHKDGVLLKYHGKSSTYLPSVWDDIPDPQIFLSRLCHKQGSPMLCWQDQDVQVYRYKAFRFGE